ncbi:hypothetical protein V9T40_009533 [Parthenolecanium corni]|uniref:Uncharacterized protein n=1 Tax=Parthenolecanium corni TaxID=536013 RepID=A0AAN9TNP6_9HEMI
MLVNARASEFRGSELHKLEVADCDLRVAITLATIVPYVAGNRQLRAYQVCASTAAAAALSTATATQ